MTQEETMILDQFRRGTNESLFGLDTPYTEADLKKAYRALAKRYHPDTSPYSRDFCDEVMKLINQKYDYMKKLLASGQSSQQDASQDGQDSWRDWEEATGRRTQHEHADEEYYYYNEGFRRGYQEGYAQNAQQEEQKKSPIVVSRGEQVMRILNLIVMAGAAFYVGRVMLLWEDCVFANAIVHSFKTHRNVDIGFRNMFFGYVLAIVLCVIVAQFFNAIAYEMRNPVSQLVLSAIRGAVIAAAAIVIVWGIMVAISEGQWEKDYWFDVLVEILLAVVIPARILFIAVRGHR